jgi:hypothetical protein
MFTTEDPLLTRVEAGAFLGIKPETLSVWHSTQRYSIPVVKVGRSVRYRLSDLKAFLQARTIGGGNAA